MAHQTSRRDRGDRLPAAQVALAWVRQQGAIPVLGGRNQQQIAGNVASLEVTLSEAQLARLDEASAIVHGYPNDFLARYPDRMQTLSTGV